MKIYIIPILLSFFGVMVSLLSPLYANDDANNDARGFLHTIRLRELAQEVQEEVQKEVQDVKDNGPTLAPEAKAQLLIHNYGKVTHYAHNIALQILDNLEKSIYPNGQQLNLIHESLRSTILITREINRFGHNHKDDDLILKLLHLKMKILLIETSKSLHGIYIGDKFIKNLTVDQMSYKQYGIVSFEQEILSNLTTYNIKILENDIRDFLYNYYHYRNQLNDHPIVKEIMNMDVVQEVKDNISLDYLSDTRVRWSRTLNFLGMATSSTTQIISKGFGTIAGNIRWRSGFLQNNENAIKHMQKHLRPFDLIFEKRGYVLTDKTIPGHWGHVGIWLGTKDELMELGVWDRPEFAPFREQILLGKQIYEVRRWGLVFNNLNDWMNLDEAAIVRVQTIKNKSTDEMIRIFEDLYAQWEKDYDFGFDAMTTNKITCTEIISLSYGNINWPMNSVMNRQTISPTNMAELVFYKNSPLEFVAHLKGDKHKMIHQLSINQFADAIDYKKINGVFKKMTRECHNENYRVRNRGGIRFRNVCQDKYTTMEYRPIHLPDNGLFRKVRSFF